MTNSPEVSAADDLPDDSWMPDLPDAPPQSRKSPTRPKRPVTPLRPLEALGQALDDAPLAPGSVAPPPQPPPPPADRGQDDGSDATPGDDRPEGEIWAGCPVRPLGYNGGTLYYLDALSQLRPITKLDAQNIMMLFANRLPALFYKFPKWIKDYSTGSTKRKPDHFEHQPATATMIRACGEKGLFDPENAVRGCGAWADDDGQLVYHMGDRILIGKATLRPDTHQGRIYPAYPPIPHPADADMITSDPAQPFYDVLTSWQWSRPDIDPFIAMGLFGVQAFGGALDWRPAFWIAGGPGSGKSALQRLMLHLHGGEKGLVQSTDPTARGIASQLGQSTMPVALDELEPGDSGSTKERDIIVTARVAASGGRWLRGSSDQKGSSGQLRSTFLFSSILIPGILKSQDLQRIIRLELGPFAEGAKVPDLRAETWRKRGAAIKRQIIDRWPTWAARLELWREALAIQGIGGRDADNWATTCAMAQMIQAEAMPTADELAGWAAKIARRIKAELGEAGSDADEVLTHLLTQYFDPFRRGTQWTIAQWLMVAGCLDGAPEALQNACASNANDSGTIAEIAAKVANNHLAPLMIRVIREHGQEPRLFVGNAKAVPLLYVFRDTQWQGGAWSQSLARVKGAKPSNSARRIGGQCCRGWELPFSAMPGLAGLPADRVATSAAPEVVDVGDWY